MPELPFAARAPGDVRPRDAVRGPPSALTKLLESPSLHVEVNRKVSPEESERWIVTIGVAGILTPLFSFWIAVSFQVVIEPE